MPFQKIPIDLKKNLFGKSNTWIVVGLPDTEKQFNDSRKRGGVGNQVSSSNYFETVKFVETKFPKGHKLYKARYVPPIIRPDGERIILANRYQSYFLKQKRFQKFSEIGLNITLGACKSDFICVANSAFANDGLLLVLTHFENSQRLEFTDGFIDVADIPVLRAPTGRGILHLCACNAAKNLRAIKLSFSENIWACASYNKLSAAASLEYVLAFASSISTTPRSFLGHFECAQDAMRNKGLLEPKSLLNA